MITEMKVQKRPERKKISRAAKLLNMEPGEVIRLLRSEHKYTSVSAQIASLAKDTGKNWSYRCTPKMIFVTRTK